VKLFNTKDMKNHAIKMLIYGPSGHGKTTLAGTTGEKTLLISAEGGQLSLKGKDVSVIDISKDDDGETVNMEQRVTNLRTVYSMLQGGMKDEYAWVVLDSLTEIGECLHNMLKHKFSDDKYALWGEYSDQLRAIAKAFRDLPGVNVIVLALSETEKDELSRRYKNIMIQGKIQNQLPAYFDEVFYLDAEEDADGNISNRRLITGASQKFIAKDRSGSLNMYEKPNIADIAKKIRG
jgi:phage nucleotide-binding protein